MAIPCSLPISSAVPHAFFHQRYLFSFLVSLLITTALFYLQAEERGVEEWLAASRQALAAIDAADRCVHELFARGQARAAASNHNRLTLSVAE